jgi:hypothetical protein
MIGATRGISTLVAAVVAGFLLWLATQIGAETAGEYWATYGVIAGAGLVFALSQVAGGWTKWGRPRISAGVFLLAFLPALLVGGWLLLARQPDDFFNTSNWSRDLGIYDVVNDLGNILPAIAFAVGLTFGLMFDTAGPRRAVAPGEVPARRPAGAPAPVTDGRADTRVDADGDRTDADEPLTAEREETAETEQEPERGRGRFGRRRRVLAGSGRREG